MQIPAVELIEVERLSKAPYNPRTITEAQFNALKKSILEDEDFFAARPCLVNRRNGQLIIYAGNMRFEAVKALGWSRVPCIVTEISEEQERDRCLRDNNPYGEYNEDQLAELVYGLNEAGRDVLSMGFTEKQVNMLLTEGMLKAPRPVDPDDVPDLPTEAISKPGELYELGKHRVLCGDSTKAEDVARLFDGSEPYLMVTDPPYGVDYDPNWRNEEAKKGNLAYADRRVGVVQNDKRVDWAEAWLLSPAKVVYCWHADRHASEVQASLEKWDFEVRSQIIWAKSNFPISRGHYHWRHEPCWYAVRGGANAQWIGDRKQTTLWDINLDKNVDGGHSTQKPVECMARPIRNHDGDVYDPFLGSGTTLIAAEQLGRICYGIEIEPKYVDVIRDRYATFVGDPSFAARPDVVEEKLLAQK